MAHHKKLKILLVKCVTAAEVFYWYGLKTQWNHTEQNLAPTHTIAIDVYNMP